PTPAQPARASVRAQPRDGVGAHPQRPPDRDLRVHRRGPSRLPGLSAPARIAGAADVPDRADPFRPLRGVPDPPAQSAAASARTARASSGRLVGSGVRCPAVTAVMPVHNREAWVGRALESVLAQTWSDFEIVVVDD